jgi:hypothetical protein
MTSVLEICQDAADELSVIRPKVVGPDAIDPTAQKLFRHLVRTCRQVAGRRDWQILRREHTFVTSGSEAQTGAIPDDFLRFVPNTMVNRTKRTRVLGPLTPGEWQQITATVYTSPYEKFIQRGNAVLFTGSHAAGQTIAYEYITKAIGLSEDGTEEREIFTSGSDAAYFDDELLISGIVWRYKKAAGDDYSEEFREHEQRFAAVAKMDGGRRKLDFNEPSEEGIPAVNGGDIIVDLTTI